MNGLSIFLSGIPPLPNETRREHWHKRSDEAKQWRQDARLLALQALREHDHPEDFPLMRAVVEIVVYTTDGRHVPDPDNAVTACKPILDGITDAGVWKDDSFRTLDRLSIRHETGSRGVRVGITIGEVQE